MRFSFKGGVHPPSSKELTKNCAVKTLAAPKKVIIPLKQHIGAILEPTVKVGDTVKIGQVIGTSESFVSAPVHATVSGTVAGIEPWFHSSGTKIPAVIIENDGKDEWDTNIKPIGDYKDLSPQEIITAVKNSGLVGMGGATFPTHIKLSPPPDKKIEYIIVNGAECEPYLTSDYRAMLEYPEEIIYGLKAVMKIFGLNVGYIGVEDNKKDGIESLKKVADGGIKVVTLKTKYPQGSEKHLIKVITGKEVPSGKLPADAGAIVINVDTAVGIANILKTGRPLIERIVTVTGNGVNSPCNLRVRIGTRFSEVLEAAGGLKADVKKLIMGGPMMGNAQFSVETPVIKGTSGLLALTEAECNLKKERNCIRCGKCVDACPMGLMPLYLSSAGKKEDYDAMKRLSILDCIECGSCTYICPSNKNPVEYIRVGKAKLQMQNLKGDKN